jgi:hypothetical protein
MRPDFNHINAEALNRYPSLLFDWLPEGRIVGTEFTTRNPKRLDNRPGSFSINIHSGKWADFATNDRGGDPISLYAYLFGMKQGEAARELAREMGVDHG